MPPASRLLAPLAVVAALGFAACGDDDSSSDDSASSGTSTKSSSGGAYAPPADTSTESSSSSSASSSGKDLKLSADPGGALKFDVSSLKAKAGTVTLTMDNPSSLPHAIAVEGNGVDKDGEVVQQGGTSTVKVELKKGTYTFYCPVPGHEEGGMKGTLTVE